MKYVEYVAGQLKIHIGLVRALHCVLYFRVAFYGHLVLVLVACLALSMADLCLHIYLIWLLLLLLLTNNCHFGEIAILFARSRVSYLLSDAFGSFLIISDYVYRVLPDYFVFGQLCAVDFLYILKEVELKMSCMKERKKKKTE